MAINTITYTNKVDVNTTATPAINKVTASDMNEIKTVVNANANGVGDVSTLTTTATTVVGGINELNTPPNIVTGGSEVRLNYQIDSKWVYAKRYAITSLATSITIAHGLTNFTLVDWDAMTLYNGTWRKLNYSVTSAYYIIDVDSTNIKYNASAALTGGSGVITLYYVKNS